MKNNKTIIIISTVVVLSLFLSGFYFSRFMAYQSDQEKLKKFDQQLEKSIDDMEVAAKEASDNAEENSYTDGEDEPDYSVDAFAMFEGEDVDIKFLQQDEAADNLMSGEKVSVTDVYEYTPEDDEPKAKDGNKIVAIDLDIENIGTPATELSTEDFNLVSFTDSYDRYGTKTFVEKFVNGVKSKQSLYFEIPEEVGSFDLQFISHDEAQSIDSGLTRLYTFALMLK